MESRPKPRPKTHSTLEYLRYFVNGLFVCIFGATTHTHAHVPPPVGTVCRGGTYIASRPTVLAICPRERFVYKEHNMDMDLQHEGSKALRSMIDSIALGDASGCVDGVTPSDEAAILVSSVHVKSDFCVAACSPALCLLSCPCLFVLSLPFYLVPASFYPLLSSLCVSVSLSWYSQGLHSDAGSCHDSVLVFRVAAIHRLLQARGGRVFLCSSPGVHWGRTDGDIHPVSAYSGGAGRDVEAGARKHRWAFDGCVTCAGTTSVHDAFRLPLM